MWQRGAKRHPRVEQHLVIEIGEDDVAAEVGVEGLRFAVEIGAVGGLSRGGRSGENLQPADARRQIAIHVQDQAVDDLLSSLLPLGLQFIDVLVSKYARQQQQRQHAGPDQAQEVVVQRHAIPILLGDRAIVC